MSEENQNNEVIGDEPQEGNFTIDATGAVVSTETAKADQEFAEQAGGNDWREQR